MFVILLKDKLRKAISYLGLDLTRNLKYDRICKSIIKNSLKADSIGIDVGCHKGEILDLFIQYAPNARHYGFEPIPYLFDKLVSKYGESQTILPYALADEAGNTVFHHVKNAPAYSGIKERKYDISNPEIDKINVELKKLDDIIPSNQVISLIKIDVEGAELGVLKGGIETVQRSSPVILFEFGLGASDAYGTKPIDIYTYFEQLNYSVYLLENYGNKDKSLTLSELEEAYFHRGEFFFVATSK
jgi:FkbM family methyltransferase